MPIKANAEKALRKSKKLAVKNLAVRSDIETAIKKIRKAITQKQDAKKIQEMIQALQKRLDKAVKNKILKKNNSARKLSRIMANFNKANKK